MTLPLGALTHLESVHMLCPLRTKRGLVMTKRAIWIAFAIAVIVLAQGVQNVRAQSTGKGDAREGFVEMKWPVGPADKLRVITLRIPKSYIWSPSSFVKSAVPIPNDYLGEQKFERVFVLEALLPDFAGRTAANENEFERGISERTITIQVTPNLGTGAGLDIEGKPLIDGLFRSQQKMLVTDYDRRTKGITLATKPDRFGLKHEGAIGNLEQFRCGIGMADDIYYPEADPKDMFAVCGAEEIRDVTEDARWCAKPICTQYFYSSKFGAAIQLAYRRTYLKNWRELQQRAERLLESIDKIQ